MPIDSVAGLSANVTDVRDERRASSTPQATGGIQRDLLILGGVAASCVIVAFRAELLPARFSFDADRIQGIAAGSQSAYGDKNYQQTANVYRWLGLEDSPFVVGLLSFALVALGVLLARRRARAHTSQGFSDIIAPIALVLGAVFLGTYSKDVITLPIAIVAIMGTRRRGWDALVVALCCVYAYFFRDYWFLVAGSYVAIRVLLHRNLSIRRTLIVTLLLAVMMGCAVAIDSGTSATFYRDSVNMYRLNDPDAATIIPNVFDASGLQSVVNVGAAFVMLLIPFPLLALGTAYHATLFVLICFIWASVLLPIRRNPSLSPPEMRALALSLAFLSVQALFEPDYGSYLRHTMSIMPALLVLAWRGTLRARPQTT